MDTIGGYRLVRRLGAGVRAEVFLGHSDSAARATTVAIKIFRPGVDEHSVDQEIAVLSRSASRHLLRLHDVATTTGGQQCLVLQRLGGGSLARLLAEGPQLRAGEAVTVLAPVADAIAQLHALRCCHGALGPRTVHFDEAGAPVVACFGQASTFGTLQHQAGGLSSATTAELTAEEGVLHDLRQLRALANAVMVHTMQPRSGNGASDVVEWLDETGHDTDVPTFARELRDRLFDWASPLPVPFKLPPSGRPSRVSANGPRAIVRPHGTTDLADSRETVPTSLVRSAHGWPQLRVAVDRGRTASTMALRQVKTSARRGVGALSVVRKRFWVAGGIGIAALVLAALLVPSAVGSREGPPPDADARAAKATSIDGAGASGSPTPAKAESASAGTPGDNELLADDPVVAVSTLLSAREGCIRKLSVTCLDGVDQRGSSSWEDDSYLIRSLQEGGAVEARSFTGSKFVMTQRLGDSALLTAEHTDGTAATAILLVKSESGWRIRDFVQV